MENEKIFGEWYGEGHFFTDQYIRCDNSLEGFTKKHRTLRERTLREVEGVMNLTNINQGAKILDLPCGYGRHSIEFAKKGFVVTGIDKSKNFLDIAKKESASKDLNITFLQGDMRNLGTGHEQKYDLVTNLSFSFGFFKNEEDNERTMQQFYDSLRYGGQLILHTDICPEMMEKNYRLEQMRNLPKMTIGDTTYLAAKMINSERYDKKDRRIIGTWKIIEGKKTISLPEYSVRIYSQKEFYYLCKKIGFTKVRFYGNWKEKFDPKIHEELTLVAIK